MGFLQVFARPPFGQRPVHSELRSYCMGCSKEAFSRLCVRADCINLRIELEAGDTQGA